MLNGATLGLMAAAVAGTINAATVNTNNSGFSSATCKNGFGTPFYVNINNSQCLRTASVGQTCQVTCALGFSASPASSTYSCKRYTQGRSVGYKWVGTCPVCIRCPAIANSNSNIVNTACPVPGVPQAFPALGFKCNAAFYLQEGASNAVADTCKACTAIVGGSGPITCTSASNSRAGAAFTCNTGFVLWKAGANQTIADACVPDPCAVGTNPCADGSYCQAVPDAIVPGATAECFCATSDDPAQAFTGTTCDASVADVCAQQAPAVCGAGTGYSDTLNLCLPCDNLCGSAANPVVDATSGVCTGCTDKPVVATILTQADGSDPAYNGGECEPTSYAATAWCYQKSLCVAHNKMQFTIASNVAPGDANHEVQDLQSVWSVLTFNAATVGPDTNPFITIYTFPSAVPAENLCAAWYHAKATYIISTADAATIPLGEKVVLYVGNDPFDVEPDAMHIKLVPAADAAASCGAMLPNDKVYFVALNTNSATLQDPDFCVHAGAAEYVAETKTTEFTQ